MGVPALSAAEKGLAMAERSQVFLLALAAFIGGIGFASFFPVLPQFVRIGSVAAAFLFASTAFDRRAAIGGVVLFVFLFGIVRFQSGPFSFASLVPVRAGLEAVRDGYVHGISRALPEPQASYLAGVLVGVRRDIPSDLKQAFRRTGTSHLTALSGYNVTVIANMFGFMTRSLLISIGGIILFVLATGASPSVVRAAIMGALVLLARREGREFNMKTALLAAVALMLFFDPELLRGDIGFQLSVLATAGLLYIAPYFDSLLRFMPARFGVREAASATLAAQIATFPLILYYFGAVSLLAPLANILVVVTVPAVMAAGLVAGLAGIALPPLSAIFAFPAYLILSYQIGIIQFFASLDVF